MAVELILVKVLSAENIRYYLILESALIWINIVKILSLVLRLSYLALNTHFIILYYQACSADLLECDGLMDSIYINYSMA